MSKIKITPNITIDDNFFVAEKTSDVFKEVTFKYGKKRWNGLLPKRLVKQGLDLTDKEFMARLKTNYKLLNQKNSSDWIKKSNSKWSNKKSETYKVLKGLYSGKWECRVCGPVPEVNPQPAARLGALKKMGYIIGSKRKICLNCSKKTMHDILIMLPDIKKRFKHGNELRSAMSETLKAKIKKNLGFIEACFNVKRSPVELLIDHKFPSQRWNKPERENPDEMTDTEISKKFQLLSNQTNMWKSRYCDNCIKNRIRGDFMGIQWFFKGNKKWVKSRYDEKGCVGCPWYDLKAWKSELLKKLAK